VSGWDSLRVCKRVCLFSVYLPISLYAYLSFYPPSLSSLPLSLSLSLSTHTHMHALMRQSLQVDGSDAEHVPLAVLHAMLRASLVLKYRTAQRATGTKISNFCRLMVVMQNMFRLLRFMRCSEEHCTRQ